MDYLAKQNPILYCLQNGYSWSHSLREWVKEEWREREKERFSERLKIKG